MSDTTAVRPAHYKNSNGVQLIEVIRWLPFSIGNAVKYLYRNEKKENIVQDLNKCLWYLDDYKSYPCRVSEDHHISSEVISKCFEGVNDWERETCTLILQWYFMEESEDKNAVYMKIIEKINHKINKYS